MSGSTVDASIPLSFRPTPGLGDMSGALRSANALMEFQQQQQEQRGQNALRQLLSQPGVWTGQGVNPSVLPQVAAQSPQTALTLQQNMLRAQQMQQQFQLLRSKTYQEQVGIVQDAYAPLLTQYREKEKVDPVAAKAWLAEQLPVVNKELRESQAIPPERKLVETPDPVQLERVAAGADWIKQWNAEQDRKDREARQERHETAAENIPVVRPDGKILSYNRVTGQVAPTEMPVGTVPLSKAPAAGSTGATMAAVEADVRTKHPDWTSGQVALEARHQFREAGEAGVGLTPEQVDLQARLWLKTGHLDNLGFSSKKDREAVLNRAGQLAKENNTTVDDIVAGRVKLATDKQAMGQLEKVRNAAGAFEKGAQKEFDLVLSQIPKTVEPLNSQALTRWTRSGEREFGDLQIPRYQVALISALDEYAKVLAGNYGIGGSTDASREQALSVIPPGATSKQIPEIVDIIKRSMKLKLSGYDEQLREMREDLGSLTPKHETIVKPEEVAAPRADEPKPKAQPSDGSALPAGRDFSSFPHPKTEANRAKLKKGDFYVAPDNTLKQVQ